jgi:hypothetical protein
MQFELKEDEKVSCIGQQYVLFYHRPFGAPLIMAAQIQLTK